MRDDLEWNDPTEEPEVGELLLSRTGNGRVRVKARLDRVSGMIIEQAIEKMAASLPRDATTTDEQHRADAFLAVTRWYTANPPGGPQRSCRAVDG